MCVCTSSASHWCRRHNKHTYVHICNTYMSETRYTHNGPWRSNEEVMTHIGSGFELAQSLNGVRNKSIPTTKYFKFAYPYFTIRDVLFWCVCRKSRNWQHVHFCKHFSGINKPRLEQLGTNGSFEAYFCDSDFLKTPQQRRTLFFWKYSKLQYIAAWCCVLQCVAVCCRALQCVHVRALMYVLLLWILCCSVLQCVAAWCSVLECVAVCCSVWQCVNVRTLMCVLPLWILCCSVLQCVAAWCSVLQCVAVCCSVLQCVDVRTLMGVLHLWILCCSVMQSVAVCCSVLLCVGVYCSVL